MQIVVEIYPATFVFQVEEPLPPFKYGCKVRRKILIKEMNLQNIDSPCHAYEDYIVESIEKIPVGERWHLGS